MRTLGWELELMVALEMSPMILSAYLHAWYIRSISSRRSASSALSSIIPCCNAVTVSIHVARVLSEAYRVSGGVEAGQKLAVNE